MPTELGKAYIQIMPSAKGIKSSLQKELNQELPGAGIAGGNTLASSIKGVIATAGIGALIGKTLNEGGALQQSLGGVETLFKQSADTVKAYASQSFSSTGLSANEYMENVTSFSASLISSLSGDTAAAAELANTAMVDMSDNANKMGTDMEIITQTYQSLARGNYEMLDNLKLGYGGTKSEMERLMADAEKLTGEHYTVGDFADTVKAIHAIQDSLDITGTTAKEAATTLTGSYNSMKAAAKDFMGNLAIGADITTPIVNLVTSASTFLFGNLVPMIGNIAMALPQAAITAITTAGPVLVSNIGDLVDTMISSLSSSVPEFLAKGNEMLNSIWEGINTYFPQLLSNLSGLINNMITFLMTNAPQFLEQGSQLILNMSQGVIQSLPTIVSSITSLVINAIATLAMNLPQFITKGIEIVSSLIAGLIRSIPNLLSSIGTILGQAASQFLQYDWISIGLNIIQGIVNGIISAAGNIASALLDAAKSAFDSVLGFFQIKSPSRLMDKRVGEMLPAGVAVGIKNKASLMKTSMIDASKKAIEAAQRTISTAQLSMLSSSWQRSTGIPLTGTVTNVVNNNMNQTINSAKKMSPREIALQTESVMRRLKWQ